MGQDHSLDTCDFLSLITPTPTQQEQPEEAAIIPRVYYPITSVGKMSGILTTKTMSLAVADEIATLAIKACKTNGFKPISICVMDPAGHEIVTKRMDGCPVSIMYFVILFKMLFAKDLTGVIESINQSNLSIISILVRQLHTPKFRMQKQQRVYQQKLHHVHTVQNI